MLFLVLRIPGGAILHEGSNIKNVTENKLIQAQEFYGKRFLVKDQLQPIQWKIESESKQIGNYLCFKATAVIPSKELSWYSFFMGRFKCKSRKS